MFQHDNYLIHRDIKAENVFFADVKRNIVKVGDFGFATQVKNDCLKRSRHPYICYF